MLLADLGQRIQVYVVGQSIALVPYRDLYMHPGTHKLQTYLKASNHHSSTIQLYINPKMIHMRFVG
jgi:hypothetical protein